MVMLFWQTNGNLINKLFIRSSGFCSYLCDDVRKGLIYKNKEFEDDERFVGVVTNGTSK